MQCSFVKCTTSQTKVDNIAFSQVTFCQAFHSILAQDTIQPATHYRLCPHLNNDEGKKDLL